MTTHHRVVFLLRSYGQTTLYLTQLSREHCCRTQYQKSLAKTLCREALCRRQWFSPGTPPTQVKHAVPFDLCAVTLTVERATCRSHDNTLRGFSFSILCLALWGKFALAARPGQAGSSLNFSPCDLSNIGMIYFPVILRFYFLLFGFLRANQTFNWNIIQHFTLACNNDLHICTSSGVNGLRFTHLNEWYISRAVLIFSA